jgi:hypothetical protein
MMHMRARAAGGLLGVVLSLSVAMPAIAAEGAKPAVEPTGPPSATLELASEQMRLIMGGTKGKGTLHFNGADHVFTFKSASVGVGAKAVTSVSATGKVYGLKKLEDFAGTYTAITRTALAGSAEVSATYKNDKDVVVKLQGTVMGVGLGLGGGVATIELVKK